MSEKPSPAPGNADPAIGATELSRRDALKLAAGAVAVGLAAGGCQGREGVAVENWVLRDPLRDSSAMALARAIRSGEITSYEVVEAFLARIAEVNPRLNAVVQLRAEGALADAREADLAAGRGEWRGALHGVPMTIKDSLDTAGVVSTGGMTGRRAHVPEHDATAVRRLRAAGAILLGKTNTPELTLSFQTDNDVYGRTNNPWDLERSPGGSSGGAAAILAAGGSAFDIGSDYGGSIRLPSHFNGICGIKPTHGRVSRHGHVLPFGGTHDSFQQIGPLARWVEDLHPLLAIIAGPDNIDPAVVPMPLGDPALVDMAALRIGFHTDNGVRTPTAETRATVGAAAAALAGAGARIEESRPAAIERSFEVGSGFFGADGGIRADRLRALAGQPTSPNTGARARDAIGLDNLFTAWYDVRSQMTGYFDDHDVILCPVNAQPAPLHGATNLADFSYTITYNVTGWPAGVVRCGTSPEGLPIGVQIVAAPAREDRVLAVAAFLERELGGFSAPTL